MRIRFLPESEAELLEAASWYREQALASTMSLCAVLMMHWQRWAGCPGFFPWFIVSCDEH
ncbi:MAG: hypothetical protein P1P74_12180 [Desulfuromonadales bacterium]|nr:hypothetical protein [Desulfuromonadales bacterium]